jgi:hypothetical protein
MYRLIIIICLCFSIICKADTDYNDYNIIDEKGFTKAYNIASKNYKVKDFYGTWVAVSTRQSYSCIYNAPIPLKPDKLGKKIIIQPNFYQNTLHDKDKIYSDFNAYFGRKTAFYSTEVFNSARLWGSAGSPLYGVIKYESFFIFDKNKSPNNHEPEGDLGLLFIKNNNTLIYWEYSYDEERADSELTLYMLIREEEAKKIDKYEVYIPTRMLDDAGEQTYYDDDGNEKKSKATICGKQYDEYAKKLEAEGKYKVIRDSKMARNFIDID